MLISDSYRDLNQRLHDKNIGYGQGGWTWIAPVLRFMRDVNATTVIDYGCGKGAFGQWTPPDYQVINYDPVTFPTEPEPQDFLVCLDVLEHIEPEHLDAVLDHIRRLTRKACFLVIALHPAQKVLEDGRNAHLIVQTGTWWREKLAEVFQTVELVPLGIKSELVVLCRP